MKNPIRKRSSTHGELDRMTATTADRFARIVEVLHARHPEHSAPALAPEVIREYQRLASEGDADAERMLAAWLQEGARRKIANLWKEPTVTVQTASGMVHTSPRFVNVKRMDEEGHLQSVFVDVLFAAKTEVTEARDAARELGMANMSKAAVLNAMVDDMDRTGTESAFDAAVALGEDPYQRYGAIAS